MSAADEYMHVRAIGRQDSSSIARALETEGVNDNIHICTGVSIQILIYLIENYISA